MSDFIYEASGPVDTADRISFLSRNWTRGEAAG